MIVIFAIVTVIKMSIFEDRDDLINRAIEEEDKKFLEALKSAKNEDVPKLEESYKKNLEKIIGKYHAEFSKLLKKNKDGLFEEENVAGAEEKKEEKKEKYLNVKKLNFKKTPLERFKSWFDIFWFRLKISIKNFMYKVFPHCMIAFFFKNRVKAKYRFKNFKWTLGRIVFNLKVWLFNLGIKIKNFFVKIFLKLKKFYLFLSEKLFSIVGKGEKKEKAEGEKKEDNEKK
ncbi:MAG: hypothetical protein OQK82_03040 [Candidatus Pacearchaeota archaeon]|nr:hypothetical protein [Candidatus Pacearchaeota archaeon]